MKNRVAFFALLALLAGGCSESLEEALLNKECAGDSECAPSQTCVKTQYQVQLAQFGVCRPDDDAMCLPGAQAGCGCLSEGCNAIEGLPAVKRCHAEEAGGACVCVLEVGFDDQNEGLNYVCPYVPD